MADNAVAPDARVIGVAFDGAGLGPDGVIWGGEVLIAGYCSYTRALHLAPCPQPGGDAAVRHPCRMALAWLRTAGIAWSDVLPPVAALTVAERDVLEHQLAAGVNTPQTTSMGRLFDAVGTLCGLAPRITYEAQAACELEAIAAAGDHGAYPFAITGGRIDPAPALAAIVDDVRQGTAAAVISARFHAGIAEMVTAACAACREATDLNVVALSGGVWQNLRLLEAAVTHLEAAGFCVLVHRRVPANDGGLALGQAAVAAAQHSRGVLAAAAAAGR
jgi:hydrogenase maturation protein HypF